MGSHLISDKICQVMLLMVENLILVDFVLGWNTECRVRCFWQIVGCPPPCCPMDFGQIIYTKSLGIGALEEYKSI